MSDIIELHPSDSEVVGPTRTRKRRWNPGILLALIFALVYVATRSPAPMEGWWTDFDEARSEAVATGRKMLVKFTLPGCPACVVMDRTVLREPDVIDALADFVPVRLDAAQLPDLAQRYGVYAAPSFVVTDVHGVPIRRVEGVVPVGQFLAFLSGTVTSLAGAAPDPLGAPAMEEGLPVGP